MFKYVEAYGTTQKDRLVLVHMATYCWLVSYPFLVTKRFKSIRSQLKVSYSSSGICQLLSPHWNNSTVASEQSTKQFPAIILVQTPGSDLLLPLLFQYTVNAGLFTTGGKKLLIRVQGPKSKMKMSLQFRELNSIFVWHIQSN